jgi:adenylate cyclase
MRDLVFSPGVNVERWDRAQALGRKAWALDPGFAQAPALMAIFHAMASLNGWGGGSRDEVLARGQELAEQALALAPDDPLANVAVAAMARFAGDFETARTAIERALAVTPDAGIALFLVGDVAVTSGRPQDAIPVLERAIRHDPAWSHQHLQFLGIAHYLLGHYETAALVFEERLVLMPGTDIGRAWPAAALAQTGRTEEAHGIWAELMKMDPAFDIETWLQRFGFARPEDPAAMLAGLAKAGIVTAP